MNRPFHHLIILWCKIGLMMITFRLARLAIVNLLLCMKDFKVVIEHHTLRTTSNMILKWNKWTIPGILWNTGWNNVMEIDVVKSWLESEGIGEEEREFVWLMEMLQPRSKAENRNFWYIFFYILHYHTAQMTNTQTCKWKSGIMRRKTRELLRGLSPPEYNTALRCMQFIWNIISDDGVQ